MLMLADDVVEGVGLLLRGLNFVVTPPRIKFLNIIKFY